jgi:hypothetical protein
MTEIRCEITKYGYDKLDDELWVIKQELKETFTVDEPDGLSFMDNSGLDGYPRLSEKATCAFKKFESEWEEKLSEMPNDVVVAIISIDGEHIYIIYP